MEKKCDYCGERMTKQECVVYREPKTTEYFDAWVCDGCGNTD